MGVINVGGPGVITIDGQAHTLNGKDGIYIGMGAKELAFRSLDKGNPAKFYLNSCPAHRTCPTVLIPHGQGPL